MARHVHIHLHARTADAFEESKHPRQDDGKFGQGHGSPRKAPDPRKGPFVQHAQQHASGSSRKAPDPNKGPFVKPAAQGERSGKSEYAKAREAEHDNRRDADYARRLAEAKAKAAEAAKKKQGRPAKEPKPKAEPRPAPAAKKPAKTQEQKDAERRTSLRQRAAAAHAKGDTALAKQLLSEIRKVDAEVEREERRR